MYGIYGNGGGINKVIKSIEDGTITSFQTLLLCLNYVASNYHLTTDDVSIVHYTYDDRIKRNVFMIVNKEGSFLQYMIEF